MTKNHVSARIVRLPPTVPHPIRVEILAGMCRGIVFCVDPDQAERAEGLIGSEVSVTFHPDDQFARVCTDVTLADYYRTGVQDCQNVMSIDEFDVRDGMRKGWTAEQIVDHALDGEDWQDHASWLEQQEATDAIVLGVDGMWAQWKAGWRSAAIRSIGNEMRERCAVCGGRDEGNTCCDQPTSARRTLVVTFDVTGWTAEQIDSLAFRATVQGEALDDHEDERRNYPDVTRTAHEVRDAAGNVVAHEHDEHCRNDGGCPDDAT